MIPRIISTTVSNFRFRAIKEIKMQDAAFEIARRDGMESLRNDVAEKARSFILEYARGSIDKKGRCN